MGYNIPITWLLDRWVSDIDGISVEAHLFQNEAMTLLKAWEQKECNSDSLAQKRLELRYYKLNQQQQPIFYQLL